MSQSRTKKYFREKWKSSKYFKFVIFGIGLTSCVLLFTAIYGFVSGGYASKQYSFITYHANKYNVYKNDILNTSFKNLQTIEYREGSSMTASSFKSIIDNHSAPEYNAFKGFIKDNLINRSTEGPGNINGILDAIELQATDPNDQSGNIAITITLKNYWKNGVYFLNDSYPLIKTITVTGFKTSNILLYETSVQKSLAPKIDKTINQIFMETFDMYLIPMFGNSDMSVSVFNTGVEKYSKETSEFKNGLSEKIKEAGNIEVKYATQAQIDLYTFLTSVDFGVIASVNNFVLGFISIISIACLGIFFLFCIFKMKPYYNKIMSLENSEEV